MIFGLSVLLIFAGGFMAGSGSESNLIDDQAFGVVVALIGLILLW